MFDYHPIHLMSLFLNPRTRKMKQCTAEQRNSCLEYIKQEMILFDALRNDIASINNNTLARRTVFQPTQSFRIMERYYEDESEQDDSPTTTAAMHQAVIDSYLKFGSDKSEERSPSNHCSNAEEYNPLHFWRLHHHSYPRLAKIAKRIFAVPATSAAVEREFSLTGNIITKKRSRLSPDIVDDIIFQIHFCL